MTSGTIFDVFGTDKKAEVEGVEFKFGNSSIYAKRAGNANKLYTATVRRLFAPHRRQINNDTIDPDIINELMMRAYAKSVIIGWNNITNRENVEIPFNEENFVWLMNELPDLWEALQENCTKLANFRTELNEQDGSALGNS